VKSSHLNSFELRLQKYLALCGIASRRKSKEIIISGRVKVNGITVLSCAYKINELDSIEIDGKKIKPQNKIYIVLNKPSGYVCTHNEKSGKKTIYDLINLNGEKVFSAGRLDYNSCGLLILTNDGDFSNNLIHPSKKVIKEYKIKTSFKIPDELISNFKSGLKINDIYYKAEDVKLLNNKTVLIYLNEGKKREIREVFKYFSLNIDKLERTAIGKMNLNNLKLKEGEYKFFSLEELIKMIY